MSGLLKVSFTHDMPPAAVEVVAPDLSTVDRLWLSPGDQKAVDVPSEESLLRVHLASGEIVTLKDPGNLDRTISLSDIRSRRARSSVEPSSPVRPRTRREVQRQAAAPVPETAIMAGVHTAGVLALEGDLKVTLVEDERFPEPGDICEDSTAVVFRPGMSWRRYLLTLEAGDVRVRVRLPGSTSEITVRSNKLPEGQRIVSVRAQTHNAHADTIAGYLHRGDLHSASSMADWAEKAEDMLESKMSDPFAAAVGAYLLLRLRRIELLHDWTLNLMRAFPELPDGVVIRAWHLIYRRGDETEIRQLFARALDGPLPIFTEGLRLLSDGARVLGQDSDEAVKKLNHHARRALSRSPFTATWELSGTTVPRGWDVDIDYSPRV